VQTTDKATARRMAADERDADAELFFKKLFDIPKNLPQAQARSRPLLNLRRKFLNSGVDFLPLLQG
jgi:hypothetical protein